MGNPHTLYQKLNIANGIPGIDAVAELVGANLAITDPNGELQPWLATQVPTIENGLWKLFPDGRMETVWRLRPSLTWHDGAPFTAEDVLFTARLGRDRELPQFRVSSLDLVESVEAPDAHTFVVKWREPYFAGNLPFEPPLPAHILQEPSVSNKAEFVNLPYWTEEFVGTGPYRLREFERGVQLSLEAFDQHALGRPRIDTIEVRFIPDSNTLLANVLAGAVQLTMGRTLSVDQGQEAREHWSAGRVEFAPSYMHRILSQLRSPTPAVIADARFRQGLFHATDRQGIADAIFYGMTTPPRSWLIPNQPPYQDVEASVRQYEFDPRKAAQIIESLGYPRGADGSFSTSGGQRLSVELRATGGDDTRQKMHLAIADQWQRAGVGVDVHVIPRHLNQDREYRARRPGFVLTGGSSDLATLGTFISTAIPTPENNYTGSNDAAWANPRYDELYARYLVTLSREERLPLMGEMLRMVAEEVPAFPILYQVDVTAISHRLDGVSPYSASNVKAWNAHLWDLK